MKHTPRRQKAMRHIRAMNEYSVARRHMEELWELVKTPVKFPSPQRRRREDREIPKAA